MQQKWNQNFDGEPMTDIPQKFLNAGCDVYMVMQLRHDEKIFDERFASMRELNRRGKTPINAHVKNENKHNYMENADVKAAIEEVEKKMAGEGRVLIRPSGTEPLVRVMLEGSDTEKIRPLARDLADLIESKLS